MKRLGTTVVTALALSLPLAVQAPAHANHTLCDNEPSDINDTLGLGIGVDANTPGGLYFCAGYVLILVGTTDPGRVSVCTHFTPDGNPGNDVCPIRQ